jgi:hypothetical protein
MTRGKRAGRGKRHRRFRDRCYALLKHEKRWMSAYEIFTAFLDGHPKTLTSDGYVSHQKYIPNPTSGQMTHILKYDDRFEHRKSLRGMTSNSDQNRYTSTNPKHMITEWRAKDDNDSEVR